MFDLNLIPDPNNLDCFSSWFWSWSYLSSDIDSVPDIDCVPSLDCDPDPYSDSAPDLLLSLILILILIIELLLLLTDLVSDFDPDSYFFSWLVDVADLDCHSLFIQFLICFHPKLLTHIFHDFHLYPAHDSVLDPDCSWSWFICWFIEAVKAKN